MSQLFNKETAAAARPDYFDELRRNGLSIQRIQNVDVVEISENQTLGFCHIPYYFPFSFLDNTNTRKPFEVQGPFEGAAAIYLAMRHLNTGNGSVVPEVQHLHTTCPLRFTLEIADTELWETTTVNQVIDMLERNTELEPRTTLPCAFLGAGRSAVTMPMSIITGVKNMAQMSGLSTSPRLDDRSQYKLFSRLIPSDDGTSLPAILYFRDVIQTNHVAVLHDTNAYSTAYLESLLKAQAKHAPELQIKSIDIPFHNVQDHHLQTAIKFIKETQYRYIFALIDGPTIYKRLLTEAYHQGIAGDDHVWIYSDSLFESTITSLQDLEPNDPLAIASRGSSMLVVQPGLDKTPSFDNFIKAYQELNEPAVLEYLQAMLPQHNKGNESLFVPLQVERIFQTTNNNPGANAIFLYDAMIAMGLAACHITTQQQQRNNSNYTYFDGEAHYQQIVQTRFVGASGHIQINPSTGSRDPESAYFQLRNFVQRTNPDETGKVYFESVQTNLFRQGAWETVVPYSYGDGTNNMPHSLPQVVVDYNYIQPGLRGVGFASAALVMVLSFIFGVWTVRHRKSKVVCASQPIFLNMISVGVLCMGSAIIPLSFDDKICSGTGCDVACMTTPWLFVLGFAVTFAALFSKTWRINRIFHQPTMKRIKVTAFDVMKPLIALVLVDVIVLALWTALSPLKWEREITGVDVFGQTISTEGGCKSRDWIIYSILLCILNLGALCVAAYQAYLARDIAVEFAESTYIGRAIATFMLACLYGIPLLAITWDNPSARYFMLMALSLVCSLSVLLFIFVPKIAHHRKGRFAKASHLVRQSVGPKFSNGDDAASSTAFVSGVSSHGGGTYSNTFSERNDSHVSNEEEESSEESLGGVRVVDRANLRAKLRKKNKELEESQKRLQARVHELEKEKSGQRNELVVPLNGEDKQDDAGN